MRKLCEDEKYASKYSILSGDVRNSGEERQNSHYFRIVQPVTNLNTGECHSRQLATSSNQSGNLNSISVHSSDGATLENIPHRA